MKIKDLCRETGLTEKTVRYYEENELICPRKEYRNGKYWRDYTQADAQTLKAVATLRKARFTVSQIRQIQSNPHELVDIIPEYRREIKDERAEMDRLSQAAATLEGRDIRDIFDLAKCVEQATENIELPKRDVSVNFGRFDNISDEEREQAYERFLAKQNERQMSGAEALAIVLGFISCMLILTLALALRGGREKNGTLARASTAGWYYWYDVIGSGNDRAYAICRRRIGEADREIVYSVDEDEVRAIGDGFGNLAVTNDRVYFVQGGALSSVAADGSDLVILYNPVLSGGAAALDKPVTVRDGNVYFFRDNSGSFDEDYALCLVRETGENRMTLDTGAYGSVLAVSDGLWYFKEDTGIVFLSFNTNLATVCGTPEDTLGYLGNITYFPLFDQYWLTDEPVTAQDAAKLEGRFSPSADHSGICSANDGFVCCRYSDAEGVYQIEYYSVKTGNFSVLAAFDSEIYENFWVWNNEVLVLDTNGESYFYDLPED